MRGCFICIGFAAHFRLENSQGCSIHSTTYRNIHFHKNDRFIWKSPRSFCKTCYIATCICSCVLSFRSLVRKTLPINIYSQNKFPRYFDESIIQIMQQMRKKYACLNLKIAKVRLCSIFIFSKKCFLLKTILNNNIILLIIHIYYCLINIIN